MVTQKQVRRLELDLIDLRRARQADGFLLDQARWEIKNLLERVITLEKNNPIGDGK